MSKNKRKRISEIHDKLIPETQEKVNKSQKQLSDLNKELQKLISELNNNNDDNNKVKISDHALIRYIERVKGIKLDSFREELLTEERISSINSGSKEIKCDGFSLKIQNKTVVSVIKNN